MGVPQLLRRSAARQIESLDVSSCLEVLPAAAEPGQVKEGSERGACYPPVLELSGQY